VFVVAVTDLHGHPVDAVLAPLAAELGSTAYEVRLTLNAGLPAVLLATTDAARASAVEAAVRRHGLAGFAFDRRTLTPSARMTALRDFGLGPDGVSPSASSAERLPYADLRAIVRASHRTTTETTAEVKTKKLDLGRAVMTGGLVTSRTTTKEVVSRTEDRQQVLYLFRFSGAPWILRERDARYQGLGKDLGPTSVANFTTTIRRLRELAPAALHDERLMTPRPVRGVADGIDAADLLAHLVALAPR